MSPDYYLRTRADAETLAESVEELVADFCAEYGAVTYEVDFHALSGVSKADGHALLRIQIAVRPHLPQEVH